VPIDGRPRHIRTRRDRFDRSSTESTFSEQFRSGFQDNPSGPLNTRVEISGDQPDYWFELALVFFGVSVLLLVYAVRDQLDRSPLVITALGYVAAGGGALTAVAYIVGGDNDLFGAAAFGTMLSTVVVLFLVGSQIHCDQLLSQYSFGPKLLAWLFVISIPLGAIASLVAERLAEVGLLASVVGWIILGVGTLSRPPST
jgi:hypothetical protein